MVPKCSEVPVGYDANMDQILKIIAESGPCHQTIQFHCKNAPLRTVRKMIIFNLYFSLPLVTQIHNCVTQANAFCQQLIGFMVNL